MSAFRPLHQVHSPNFTAFCVHVGYDCHTKAANKAETEPPPGADDRSPTLSTKSFTVFWIKRFKEDDGRQYSIILSLKANIVLCVLIGNSLLRIEW